MSKPFNPEAIPPDFGRKEMDMRPVDKEELGGFVPPMLLSPTDVQPGQPLQQMTASWLHRNLVFSGPTLRVKEFLGLDTSKATKEKGE